MGLFLSKHVESILFSLRKECFPSFAVAGCLWRRRFTPKRKKKGCIFCVNIAAHHLSKTAVIRLSWKYRLFSGIEKAGGGEKAGCLFPRVNPQIWVNAICGENRAKFIAGGGRRLKRLPPGIQHNAGVGRSLSCRIESWPADPTGRIPASLSPAN